MSDKDKPEKQKPDKDKPDNEKQRNAAVEDLLVDPEQRSRLIEVEFRDGISCTSAVPEGHEGDFQPSDDAYREAVRLTAEARVQRAQIKSRLTMDVVEDIIKNRAAGRKK